jgi:hypothetical protein
VTLKTYTGDLKFRKAPNQVMLCALIDYYRQAAQEKEKQDDQQDIRDVIRKNGSHGSDHETQKVDRNNGVSENFAYNSGSLSDRLANLFDLRIEREETVTYRTHWWILIKKSFLSLLLLLAVVVLSILKTSGLFAIIPGDIFYIIAACIFLIGLVWWIYLYQDWQNDIYILNDEQVVDVYRKPLGTDDRRSAPLKNIQTVEFERKGLSSLILNYGTVKIRIGNEELTFNNVYNPSKVQSEIYARYKANLATSKTNDQQRFMDWIKAYDEIKQEDKFSDDRANDDERE